VRGATARRWFFDRVLDGNVQYPVLPVLLKPYLSRFCALRYEGVPEVFLLGVDTERYPEVRSPSRSGNPPRELVVAFFGVVKLRGLVREPYRVAVVQLLRVVRLPVSGRSYRERLWPDTAGRRASRCRSPPTWYLPPRRTPLADRHGTFRAGRSVSTACAPWVARTSPATFS